MTTEELVERLGSHRTIGGAPREELEWIAAHGTVSNFPQGATLASKGKPIDSLYLLLSGRVSILVNRGNRQRRVLEWEGGDITGLLPFSRMLSPPGDLIVEEPTEAVVLRRDDLPALVRNCYEVTAATVHTMTDRARQFMSSALRDEKMVSLGKLAAGLAHELNNPASAAMRDAKSITGALTALEDAARALGAAALSEEQLAGLDRMYGLCLSRASHHLISGLALADREEEVASWLDAHGADTATAEELAKTAVTDESLDRLANVLRGSTLDPALRWIAAGCAARRLATDIERAATRIHALVAAVKGFTHMDRDPDQGAVEISPGLADTVSLLQAKARAKSVSVTLSIAPELPTVLGISAEINQVWMNLIDNAVDAAPFNGHVWVMASSEGKDVVVSVRDDGPGIPASIQQNIFDPFFTTKSVGEGTGLGLDIVRRIVEWHNGAIEVTSEPGRTEFRVCFPALSNEPL